MSWFAFYGTRDELGWPLKLSAMVRPFPLSCHSGYYLDPRARARESLKSIIVTFFEVLVLGN